MSRAGARAAFAALALLASTAAGPGCGLGEGETSEGEAALAVTRDYGAETLVEAVAEDPPDSETVLTLLDREAEIGTRYGGAFVHSIDGIAGGVEGGRSTDWFFYVNGIESPVGAAEVEVAAGDRIWWDHHDWTDVMRVPAVVGSWPQPFAADGAEVSCAAEDGVCAGVTDALEAIAAGGADGASAPRVLVGPWADIRDRQTAGRLAGSPSRSGVFARFDGDDLLLYDEKLSEHERLGPGAGIVAALEGEGSAAPVWVVTGTDSAGVAAAAALLDRKSLVSRFAVATAGEGEPIPLPVR